MPLSSHKPLHASPFRGPTVEGTEVEDINYDSSPADPPAKIEPLIPCQDQTSHRFQLQQILHGELSLISSHSLAFPRALIAQKGKARIWVPQSALYLASFPRVNSPESSKFRDLTRTSTPFHLTSTLHYVYFDLNSFLRRLVLLISFHHVFSIECSMLITLRCSASPPFGFSDRSVVW